MLHETEPEPKLWYIARYPCKSRRVGAKPRPYKCMDLKVHTLEISNVYGSVSEKISQTSTFITNHLWTKSKWFCRFEIVIMWHKEPYFRLFGKERKRERELQTDHGLIVRWVLLKVYVRNPGEPSGKVCQRCWWEMIFFPDLNGHGPRAEGCTSLLLTRDKRGSVWVFFLFITWICWGGKWGHSNL